MRARIAAAEGLTPDDLREMLPSGCQPVFANRVGWAVTYMTRAGLLERVHRAVYRLTEEGGRLLACEHSRVDLVRYTFGFRPQAGLLALPRRVGEMPRVGHEEAHDMQRQVVSGAHLKTPLAVPVAEPPAEKRAITCLQLLRRDEYGRLRAK